MTEGGDAIFLTRVLGHLLDMFGFTVHTHTHGAAIEIFSDNANSFDARSGPPASYVHIDNPYVHGSAIQRLTQVETQFFFTRVLGHLLHMIRLTIHTYIHGVTIERFTEGSDAIFFDAR